MVCTSLSFLLSLTLFLKQTFSYNIDVVSAYVIKAPDSQSDSYFGFSTALHQYISQEKNYILVGAPKASWTSGSGQSIDSPGAVYSCELEDIEDPVCDSEQVCEEHVCDEQITYLTEDNVANSDEEDKSNQWLGVNVQSSNDYVSACAHRYMWFGSDGDKRIPIGKCTVIGDSLSDMDNVQRKILYPCKEMARNHDQGSCQVGSSATQKLVNTTDDAQGTAYLFYGAPGADIWEGMAYLSVNLDDIQGSKKIEKAKTGSNNINQYNGFATAICQMSGVDEPIDFITSAPRANHYYGVLYFFNSDNLDTNENTLLRNSKLNEDIQGDQMGAYFGYSMACGDLNNDGYDDLLVSAPWYSRMTSAKSSIISVGRVYVFNGDPNTVVSNANKPTIIEAPSDTTSAFGLGLAHIGDINQDGYQDFAIGAPYENDMKGAVYIYHGSINGIKKTPSQVITPTMLGPGDCDPNCPTLGNNLQTFGWSISGNKDMDNNNYPDMAIGSYKSDRVVYLRALPIVDMNIDITIPTAPIDLEVMNQQLDGQGMPGTTMKICFTAVSPAENSKRYTINWTVYLDYKKSYAPRAFFQESLDSNKEFIKSGDKVIDVESPDQQCTAQETVYLNKDMFDQKTYIEINMIASIQNSDTFEERAVLKQEQVTRAKGKIVIKSSCLTDTGICQCDIMLHEPTVKYYPDGYSSIVLDNVNMIIVKYEVENLGPDNAHIPTLRLQLPPKVYFIRRTPVDNQTEGEVSQIMCAEIEEDGLNYVECFLNDPLEVLDKTKFGISLDVKDLTDTDSIELSARVDIGSPSEESEEDKIRNNGQSKFLKVGRQANLDIRGTPATPRNTIRSDPTLLINNDFVRSIKLEVRHTVSVSIEETEGNEGDEDGISDIVVEINWPMKTKDGDYLLYLSEVYVKDNQIKDNFVVDSDVIDPKCLFEYNIANTNVIGRCPEAVTDGDGSTTVVPAASTSLNTNCANNDTGCVTFNVTINLLKAGSINMKDLEFEMRSVMWLPTIINQGNFNATSTARIVKVGNGLVIKPGSYIEMKTEVSEETSKETDVLWIIVGSVIGGLVILAVLIVGLWKVGFFKRKMPPKDGAER